MSLAQGNNTPTRPKIEPGSPDPESDALTIRPVRSPSKYLLSSDQTWSYKLKYINIRKTANLLFRKLKLEFVMSMTSTCWRLFNMHSFDAILYNGVAMLFYDYSWL